MSFLLFIISLLIGYTLSARHSLFGGFIPSAFTPVDLNGTDIDVTIIQDYVDELKNREISTVFILGISGESFSLSLQQKQKLIKEWVGACNSRGMSVIVNVACHSIADSITLAQYSESLKVSGITSMTYTFFKPSTNDVLYQTIEKIAQAAPSTPYLYYHIPEITSTNINIVNLVKSCYENIKNFEGIIYADNKLSELTYLSDYLNNHIYNDKHLSILYGGADQFNSLVNIGISSGISSTFNYASKIYRHIYDSFDEKEYDNSRQWQIKCDKFVRTLKKYTKDGYLPEKYLASMILNIDLGPPLLPQRELPIESIHEINATLNEMDFYSWLKYEEKRRNQKWLIIVGSICGVIFMLILSIFIWRRLKKEKMEVGLLENQ